MTLQKQKFLDGMIRKSLRHDFIASRHQVETLELKIEGNVLTACSYVESACSNRELFPFLSDLSDTQSITSR